MPRTNMKIYPETSDHFFSLLEADKENEKGVIVGALLAIYAGQTDEEQQEHSTKYRNDIGFNAFDADILSSIASQYRAKNSLSPKQITFVKKAIKKYHGQIIDIGFTPAPCKANGKQKDFPEYQKVEMVTATDRNNMEKTPKTAKLIKISFSFPRSDSRFRDILTKIKSLPKRRRWNADKFYWIAYLNIDNIESLLQWGFDIDADILEWHEKMTTSISAVDDFEIPGLGGTLYPFQKAGVNFIDQRDGKAFVGDEMGLGKTPQALAYLQLHPEMRPAVIIVPANVKMHWAREAMKWIDDPDVYVLSGRADAKKTTATQMLQFRHNDTDRKQNSKNAIFIVNYDILANATKKNPDWNEHCDKSVPKRIEAKSTGWADHIIKFHPKAVIIDEAHYIKNAKAGRTKAVRKIAKKCQAVVPMSGTPIEKRPIEFFNALSILQPDLFANKFQFAMEYCNAHHNGYRWNFSGSKNREKLHELIKDKIMIRRLKTEVLADLPEKQKTVLPVALSNAAEYARAESNIIAWIRAQEGDEAANKALKAQALVEFEKLRQIAMRGKMKQATEWIENFLESGEKLVVFAHHKKVVDSLMKKFKKVAVKIDGSVPAAKRQQIVDDFNTDDNIRLFIGTLAAREGISISSTSHLAFLELYWSPGKHDQAEDRIFGLGRGKKGDKKCNIYYLLADNTVEMDIAELLDSERQNLDMILDGKETDETAILTELMSRMKRR